MTVDSSVVVASGKLVPGGKEVVGNELSSWPSHSVTPCVGKSEFNTSYSSISSESDQVLLCHEPFQSGFEQMLYYLI